ncbi:MAG: hypothetical protein FJ044_05840, partial [Candidatus Cloacimonetes bacterium]|nr:hypothetical protein [Candidatus Cloacimonadota bacterium]
MKNALTRHWPILAILFINIFFFARLFYPQTKIFVTPDFGLSDLLHFNYPMRKVFAEAIKSHTLPLWETKIGSGLPLFAEGQAGILNIINLISAYFFPLAIGFNLTYLISYLLMGFSTFLFCRLLKLSKISSLLAAIIFSFCGYNITHFAHTHHIVTAAFLPLMFFVLEKSLSRNIRGEQTGRKIWWVILAILASQTLLGGNVQVAAYSFLALGFYFLFRILRSRKGERISTEN